MIFSSLLSIRSHPVRVRGLKPSRYKGRTLLKTVAPRAGACIETCSNRLHVSKISVAPHAGAWIETNKPEAVHQL